MIKDLKKIDEKTLIIETEKKRILLKINEDLEELHKNTKMKEFKSFFKNIEISIIPKTS